MCHITTGGIHCMASCLSRLLQALTMSNEARKTTTAGEIVNLMSVDAQRVQDATGYLWMTWSAPLQISIAVYMLWTLMGASVLAGLAVMVLIIPINAVIAALSRKLQVSQNSLFLSSMLLSLSLCRPQIFNSVLIANVSESTIDNAINR